MAKAKGPTQAQRDRWRLQTQYRMPTGPLPGGLKADSTYLAFLRGMGMDYNTAQATALQHIAQARATAATALQRDPAQYEQERQGVDANALERDAWFSGERLKNLNRLRVQDVQRKQDIVGAQAQGISDAELALRQSVSGLARSRAENVGALDKRQQDIANQDKYIAAIRAAASGGGGGGGGGGFTLGAAPGAPAAPPGAPGAPLPFAHYTPGTDRHAYFQGLTQPQQMQFAAFLHARTPGSTDPLNTLNQWLGVGSSRQGLPQNVGTTHAYF